MKRKKPTGVLKLLMLAFFLLSSTKFTPSTAQSLNEPVSEAEINKLVEQLGNQNFGVREEAQKNYPLSLKRRRRFIKL